MSSTINGLEMKIVNTTVKTYEDQEINGFDELQNVTGQLFKDSGYVVAYTDYKVLIGKFAGGHFYFYNNEIFNTIYLQKMRVFNTEKELYIWRWNVNCYGMRLRSDCDGEEQNVVDAKQVLWGTMQKQLEGGWSRLFERRGMEIILPFVIKGLNGKDNQNRVKIKTRNYIAFNQVGQAGYVDSRFVEFVPGGD